jgi:hypothetical protein
MAAVANEIVIRASEPTTLDCAAVAAVDGDGWIVGRATLSRLYGLRAEIQLDLASSDAVTLALIDALEQEACRRRLVRLELPARSVSPAVAGALWRTRPVSDARRRDVPYLTWPTTQLSS